MLAKVAAIAEVCERHGVPLRRAALRFAAAHPAVLSVVLGAVTPGEVADAVSSFDAPIPVGLWAELKSAGLLDPGAPTPA